MPGPFPGVDPYLENPVYWRGFHNGLITFITAALNAILPAGFAANYEERVYVIPPERSVYPHIVLLRHPSGTPSSGGGTAVLEPGAPHGILTVQLEENREGFVEVRSSEDWDRVITNIEVLSPANKASGSTGREEYLQKQGEILQSETHLLEIDLLRRGLHTVAAPLEGLRQRGQWDGVICLHRHTGYKYEFWLSRIRESLPPVLVPLTQEPLMFCSTCKRYTIRRLMSDLICGGSIIAQIRLFPSNRKLPRGLTLCCARRDCARD